MARQRERLEGLRASMILSSFTPLFTLWAVRGGPEGRGYWVEATCAFLILMPNAIVAFRILRARKIGDTRKLHVGSSDNYKDQLFSYLFAVMLPFYIVDLDNTRMICAHIAALTLIVVLFMHLRMHYINILFALFGYHIHSISTPHDNNPLSGKQDFIIITKHHRLDTGDELEVTRISDTVYIQHET